MNKKITKSFIDLTDQIFNRWTVIERDLSKLSFKRIYWLCQCICGNKGSIQSSHLKSGHSKSCGCLNREQVSKRFKGKSSANFVDFTGQIFERWTVIKRDLTKPNNKSFWICKCICGSIRSVSGQSLHEGISKSCGCLKIELRKKQFCPQGHDTFVTGRFPSGGCIECGKIKNINKPKHPRVLTQFCPKGHDKDIVGRTKNGSCQLCYNEYHIKYNKEHKEEITVKHNEYIAKHPEMVRVIRIKHETSRNLRIVAWTDWDKIKEFYLTQPGGMTEDHIIPLQGNEITGLHVSWNLQWLTPTKNSSKHNKCDKLEVSKWYGKLLEKEGLK